ncbi:MAG: tetratricopeptide repeat protein, partial [Candidatus Kapabacteria bacterium]|nr:tetratricopeptide repeat protein [Candidatus Kapabacteria bacterium]
RIRAVVERYVRMYPRELVFRRLLIWFLEEVGDDRSALQEVRRLDELQGATGMELLQFANAARQSEKLSLAVEAYEELLRRRPGKELRLQALYGYVRVAEMLLRQGARNIPWQQVRREYEELVRQADTLPLGAEALYSLGVFLREVAHDGVAARETFQRLVQQFPQTRWAALSLVELARLALQYDDTPQTEMYLRQAMDYDTLVPEAAEWARFWWAEVQFFRGNLDSARAGYAAVALRTGSPAANNALQRLVLFENAADRAQLSQFGQAEQAFLQRRLERAYDGYLRVAESGANDDPVTELALLRAAEVAFARQDFNHAQQLVTRLLAGNDDALYGEQALLLLGDVLEHQDRRAEAMAVYQQFLLRFPVSIHKPEIQRRIQRLREGT